VSHLPGIEDMVQTGRVPLELSASLFQLAGRRKENGPELSLKSVHLRADGEYASWASGSRGLAWDVQTPHDTPMVHSRVHGSVDAILLLHHLCVRREPGSASAK